LSRTAAPNGTLFSMDHPKDKEKQVCSNKVPGIINGHARRGHNFIDKCILNIAKTFKTFF